MNLQKVSQILIECEPQLRSAREAFKEWGSGESCGVLSQLIDALYEQGEIYSMTRDEWAAIILHLPAGETRQPCDVSAYIERLQARIDARAKVSPGDWLEILRLFGLTPRATATDLIDRIRSNIIGGLDGPKKQIPLGDWLGILAAAGLSSGAQPEHLIEKIKRSKIGGSFAMVPLDGWLDLLRELELSSESEILDVINKVAGLDLKLAASDRSVQNLRKAEAALVEQNLDLKMKVGELEAQLGEARIETQALREQLAQAEKDPPKPVQMRLSQDLRILSIDSPIPVSMNIERDQILGEPPKLFEIRAEGAQS